MRNPESVLHETIDPHSAIIYFPPARSPAMQREMEMGITRILNDLVVAEKVARRQYDELLMNPNVKGFEGSLLYIRDDEYEHEKILECIIQRLGKPAAVQPPTIKPMETTKTLTLTPKGLGELYVTILDRFAEEEQKSVRNYEEFLVKVQQSKDALKDIPDDFIYDKVAAPILELERKVNKQLNEERTHLDVVTALREMFSNMKLGNVY
jgi:rubrerythrin